MNFIFDMYYSPKIIYLFFTLFVFAPYCLFAQTYCYKKVAKVDADTKIKVAVDESFHYITFINHKGSCYFSNQNGITIKESSGRKQTIGVDYETYDGENYYVYCGEENDRFVYVKTVTWSFYVQPNYYVAGSGRLYPYVKKKAFLYFSKSFDRVNEWEDPNDYWIPSNNEIVIARQNGGKLGKETARNIIGKFVSYIYVYEKASEPVIKSNAPNIMY